jgi:hypothetical protein
MGCEAMNIDTPDWAMQIQARSTQHPDLLAAVDRVRQRAREEQQRLNQEFLDRCNQPHDPEGWKRMPLPKWLQPSPAIVSECYPPNVRF